MTPYHPWIHGYVPTATTVAGTALSYDDQHVVRARARLLIQFQGKPRWRGVMGAIIGQVQALEIALWQLMVDRRPSVAVGESLRVLARTLGIDDAILVRITDDDVLRRVVYAWIAAQRSSGRTEDLLTVARLYLSSDEIQLRAYYPAGVHVHAAVPLSREAGRILAILMRKAAQAHVAIHTSHAPRARTSVMRWSHTASGHDGGRLSHTPSGYIGGRLAGVETGIE